MPKQFELLVQETDVIGKAVGRWFQTPITNDLLDFALSSDRSLVAVATR